MKHAHNALDSALGYAARDYDDKSVMNMRGQVCNGFRTGASLIYIAKRSGIEGTEARAISLLSSSLLSMMLPEQFTKLSTSDPDSIAAQFATSELIKTKIHLLAGESVLNTDGDNHHHGHDQMAKVNITTESKDVYSIAHPFGEHGTVVHQCMRAFHDAAMEAGQAVSVEFTPEQFFIQELDAVAAGAASSVWDIGNCFCAANETIKHTNLKVEPCLLQTTPRHNDRSGPTPASLTKIVEVHNLMGSIKQWSKQNAPNEV